MVLKDVLLLLKERFGWTNEQCADNCKMGLATWKRLIYGVIDNPRMETLRLLSKGFGVSVDLLMDERNTYLMTDGERDYVLAYRGLPTFMQEDVETYIAKKTHEWEKLCEKDYRYRVRKNHHATVDSWSVDEILLAERFIDEKRKAK